MLSSIAIALPLLAASVSAAPAAQTTNSVRVQFSNDWSGANGNAWIPLNGSPVQLGQAYANTNLFKDGTLLVTSLQFTSNFQHVSCEVLKDGTKKVAEIHNPSQDFQKFSSKPLDWAKGFAISCHN
ncbi:hypothetical protein V2A60_001823 [Cordyceps javanica]|uniref:Uncharacterized protein n=1 Tax=Cordyceps javanica TaxID=43265 RepID=A0A545WD97_9HYPO|nr:hypothetical protein IF1G_00712 [Cordyceps javanica]TQW11961.1 hypothetical protein IF2G_00692 [Cordyceps javanica]